MSGQYPQTTIVDRGTNSQGNQWDSRVDDEGNTGYHYSNQDGSYYYKNTNDSTYYDTGDGYSRYTAPSGNVTETFTPATAEAGGSVDDVTQSAVDDDPVDAPNEIEEGGDSAEQDAGGFYEDEEFEEGDIEADDAGDDFDEDDGDYDTD